MPTCNKTTLVSPENVHFSYVNWKKKAKGILQLLSPAIQHIVSWKSPNAIIYVLFWSLCKFSLNQGWQAWNQKTIRPTTTMSRTFTLQVLILLMEEIPANQSRSVVYPTIYKVLYIPGGCWGFLPSTVAPKSQGFLHYVQPFLFHWILFGPTTPTTFFLLLAAWVKRKRLKEFFTKRFLLGVCKSAESSWRNPNFMGGLVSEIRSFIEF